MYRPLVGRTKQRLQFQSDLPRGEVACFAWHSYPPVVRSFAPSTGGYDTSDRKRSFPLAASTVLIHSDLSDSSDLSDRSDTSDLSDSSDLSDRSDTSDPSDSSDPL